MIISKKFKKWSRYFLKWDSFCNDKKITKELGALKFVQMFKDINKIVIGIKVLPLCIMKLCPTNSGMIVEFRDQVFIGVFLGLSLSLSTCFNKLG